MSRAARTAPIPSLPTIAAAIGTARSAKPPPPKNGLPSARLNCCPSATSTSCSRCRDRSPTSPITTRRSSMTCCSKTAAETLITIAADPKHLGARIGLTAVLHTWGSTLTHHPHAHIIVPGGGFSPKPAPAKAGGQHWIACRPRFFLSVEVLSRLFRRLFLERLTAAYQAGRLAFFADQAALAQPAAFQPFLAALRKVEWVVYAKRPFGGPDAVLAYLSRY